MKNLQHCEKCGYRYEIVKHADGTIEKIHSCVVDKAIEEYRNKLKKKISSMPFSRVEFTNITTHVEEQRAVIERAKVISLL